MTNKFILGLSALAIVASTCVTLPNGAEARDWDKQYRKQIKRWHKQQRRTFRNNRPYGSVYGYNQPYFNNRYNDQYIYSPALNRYIRYRF